ncbi:hypothetical protein CEXT_496691 [Caerostris extrusa]|uniref:Uncharacterized protein n=1 Tax=Caerostris extrusa TaxID=172846 RepID=A0AAV4VK08_CAEEX|nr:hypothetical protein CEXT_496691 [Caerostris extrusa]
MKDHPRFGRRDCVNQSRKLEKEEKDPPPTPIVLKIPFNEVAVLNEVNQYSVSHLCGLKLILKSVVKSSEIGCMQIAPVRHRGTTASSLKLLKQSQVAEVYILKTRGVWHLLRKPTQRPSDASFRSSKAQTKVVKPSCLKTTKLLLLDWKSVLFFCMKNSGNMEVDFRLSKYISHVECFMDV